MILRSRAKLFTLSNDAAVRITDSGKEGFGMSEACFNKPAHFCGCTVPRES